MLLLLAPLTACASPNASGPDASRNDDVVSDVSASEAAVEAGPLDVLVTDAPVADTSTSDAASTCPTCAMGYASVAVSGRLADPALTELSGLAYSRRHAGALYGHNDSGDRARFFALDERGTRLGEFAVQGASATDWEDMAAGACANGADPCLYFGDTGDNAMSRTLYTVYRVPEPDALGTPGAPLQGTLSAERFDFVYPDGSHNCEALVADPSDPTRVWVVLKASGRAEVYRVPLRAGQRSTAERVGELAIPTAAGSTFLVTAADAHRCAPRLLVRTYGDVLEFVAPEGSPFEARFAAPGRVLEAPPDVQGEAIAYRPTGGFLTGSEGAASNLHRAACQ